jgi:hypothetical protein
MKGDKEYADTDAEELKKAKALAKAHWKFQSKWLGMVYVDTFIHGYMHRAKEEKK